MTPHSNLWVYGGHPYSNHQKMVLLPSVNPLTVEYGFMLDLGLPLVLWVCSCGNTLPTSCLLGRWRTGALSCVWYGLWSWKCEYWDCSVFFSFQDCLAILGPLKYYANFRISLPTSEEKAVEILLNYIGLFRVEVLNLWAPTPKGSHSRYPAYQIFTLQ